MRYLQTPLLQSIIVALILEGTAAAGPALAELGRLSESEIRLAITGKVVTPETSGQYWERFYADGQWTLAYDGRLRRQEFGRWSVNDGEICVVTLVNRRCRSMLRQRDTGKIFMAQLAPASNDDQPVALRLEEAGTPPAETLGATPVIFPPRCPAQFYIDRKVECPGT
jgi:hypothetical protein